MDSGKFYVEKDHPATVPTLRHSGQEIYRFVSPDCLEKRVICDLQPANIIRKASGSAKELRYEKVAGIGFDSFFYVFGHVGDRG